MPGGGGCLRAVGPPQLAAFAVLCNLVHMATKPDYYIAAFDTGQGPLPWRWELRRHSSPMGVIVGRSGYQSQAAAEYAGKSALEEFLAALAKEERRRR